MWALRLSTFPRFCFFSFVEKLKKFKNPTLLKGWDNIIGSGHPMEEENGIRIKNYDEYMKREEADRMIRDYHEKQKSKKRIRII